MKNDEFSDGHDDDSYDHMDSMVDLASKGHNPRMFNEWDGLDPS